MIGARYRYALPFSVPWMWACDTSPSSFFLRSYLFSVGSLLSIIIIIIFFFFFILPSSFLVDFISSTDRQYSIIPISQLPFQVRIYSMILFLLFRLSFVADHKIDLDYFKIFFFFIFIIISFCWPELEWCAFIITSSKYR